jgi:hypothetical protein
MMRENSKLLSQAVNLLSVKDPLAYQAVATVNQPVYAYDPSDEAEILRMRARGVSDGAILDEWSGDDGKEFEAVRSELFGSYE